MRVTLFIKCCIMYNLVTKPYKQKASLYRWMLGITLYYMPDLQCKQWFTRLQTWRSHLPLSLNRLITSVVRKAGFAFYLCVQKIWTHTKKGKCWKIFGNFEWKKMIYYEVKIHRYISYWTTSFDVKKLAQNWLRGQINYPFLLGQFQPFCTQRYMRG